MQVERLAVYRRGIHFVIAGVDDHSDGGANRQRHAVDRAVRHVQVFNLKGSDLRRFARRHFIQRRPFQQRVLFQLLPHQRQRELRPVNRHIEIAQNVGNCADVIFVAVRQHDRANLALDSVSGR